MKRSLTLLPILILVACVGRSAAHDADRLEPIELIGHIGGVANAVSAEGDHVYAGFGAELAILDISNPVSPERVGYLVLQGVVEDLAVVGEYAYVLPGSPYDHVDAGGLRVIDVSDPTAPVEVREMGVSGTTIAVVSRYAYISDQQALRVIDVSDPASPVAVGTYTTLGVVTDVKAVDGYAYVTWCVSDARGECVRGGLDVVDVAKPRSPKRVVTLELSDPLGGPMELVGNHLYIAGRHSGLHLVDVSRPAAPLYTGTVARGRRIMAIAVQGERACVVDDQGGLVMLGVSNPGSPIAISARTILPAGSADFAIAGGYAYITGGEAGGLQVVDLSDPMALTVVGRYGGPGLAAQVFTADGHVYVANREGAFWIVDVSDPAKPSVAGSYAPPFEGDTHGPGIAVADGYAYVGLGDTVRVLDVSDPATPAEIGVASVTVSAIHGLAVHGDHLYVAGEVTGSRCRPDGGFRVLDVSDPAGVREFGGLDVDFGALADVVVEGDYAYVAGWTGLLIVDVSDPAEPAVAGSHYTPGSARSVAVLGSRPPAHTHAYVADGFFGLRMLDVSTPTAIVDEGPYGISTVTRDVAAGDGHVCVTNDAEGLWVLDVSAPSGLANPRSFHVPGRPRVAATGHWIYLLEPAGGLYLLRIP
jgi:hypothetical protein